MAVPKVITLYALNDQYLEVDTLADGLSGTVDNAATLTATLYDGSNQVVAGLNALVLAFVAASQGVYRGLVPNTFNPPTGGGYTLKIDATDSGTKLHIEIPVQVRVRRS